MKLRPLLALAVPVLLAACTGTQNRGLESVHQRCPEKLESIRNTDQAKETDRRQVNAVDGQPGLHRLPGQSQWQTRGETQKQDGKKTPASRQMQRR